MIHLAIKMNFSEKAFPFFNNLITSGFDHSDNVFKSFLWNL